MFKAQQNSAIMHPYDGRRYAIILDGIDDSPNHTNKMDALQTTDQPGTVSFWVKFPDTGVKYIWSETVGASKSVYIQASTSHCKLFIEQTGDSPGITYLNGSAPDVGVDKWVNWTITWNHTDSIKGYQNGVECSSYSVQNGDLKSMNFFSTFASFGVWSNYGIATNYSDFPISEFVVYNKMLNDDEVKIMYNKAEPFDHFDWRLTPHFKHFCTFGDLANHGSDYIFNQEDGERNMTTNSSTSYPGIEHDPSNYV